MNSVNQIASLGNPHNREDWKRLARKGQIEEAIRSFIISEGPCTFVHLARILEPYIPVTGTRSFVLSDPNVIVWPQMSDSLADAIKWLVNTDRLFLHPASVLHYLFDGEVLTLPLADLLKLGTERYESPHWFPALLSTVPFEKTLDDMLRKQGREAL